MASIYNFIAGAMKSAGKQQGLIAAVMATQLVACNQPLEVKPLPTPAFDKPTIAKLHITHALNMDEIIAHNQLTHPGNEDFITDNPYMPLTLLPFTACWNDPNCHYSITQTGIPLQAFPARETVYQWWQTRLTAADQAEVCGVRFEEGTSQDYELASFENLSALESTPGYRLTHFQRCGACSTLQDLAVYGSLDLTIMAKTCSKRLGLSAKKLCMMEIGFSEACAESWAYNADKTAQSCLVVCINEYGLIPLLTGTESSANSEDGALNQCLQCDEMISGPGFQYSAGRTRRNSGIVSEIDRPDDAVYQVEHAYFQ